MIFNDSLLLSNEVEMPKIAYGTWQIPVEDTARCVRDAIGVGYRHIDTALAYNNEREVGEGIRNSGIDRADVFVTTKVPAEIKSVEGAIESIKTSLSNLDIEYIDLLLIHAPMPWDMMRGAKRFFKENLDVWGVMEKFYAEGRIRAIGVSNFKNNDLDNIINNAKVEKPMVNQIKVHPGSSAAITLKSTMERGIVPMAYSPLGHGKTLMDPYVEEMAARYGVSSARLCMRYSIQKGCCPVVKTTSICRMRENLDLDFEISGDDMKFLSCLGTMKNLKKHTAPAK